jgi:hypothetical protein
MAIDLKPGKKIQVTISKNITQAAARKTVERLFMKDKSIVRPLTLRSRNFIDLPKRRGGQIWTKYTNKLHPNLNLGAAAKIVATPQAIRDLKSVERFVTVAAA